MSPSPQKTDTAAHEFGVFVDPTGRRRRRLALAGYLAGVGCLAYVALLVVSFLGGPIKPENLLPAPVLPAPVDKLLGIAQPGTHQPAPAGSGTASSGPGHGSHRRHGAKPAPSPNPTDPRGTQFSAHNAASTPSATSAAGHATTPPAAAPPATPNPTSGGTGTSQPSPTSATQPAPKKASATPGAPGNHRHNTPKGH